MATSTAVAAAGPATPVREPIAQRSAGRAPGRRSRWIALGSVVSLAAAAALTIVLRPGTESGPQAPAAGEIALNDTPARVVPNDPRPEGTQPSPEGQPEPQAPTSEPEPRRIQMASLDLPAYQRPSGAGDRPRLGSATRGAAQALTIEALVPDHVGRTVEAAPSLAWFLPRTPGNGSELQFSITLEQSNQVVATKRLELPTAAGIQRIDLAKLGIELAPGSRYRWSVLLRGPAAGSGGFASTQGFIERVAPDPALQQKLASASDAEQASSRAQAGLWYDALNAVLDRRAAQPGDASAEQALTAMLGAAKLSLPK